MAMLKDTVIAGSLRVTDTTYTTNLNIASTTASSIAKIDANKNLISGALVESEIPTISITSKTSGTLTVARGGTNLTSISQGGIIYGASTTAYGCTSAGTAGYLLQSNATSAPSWIQATNSNTASTIVKRDASGNFSAGTITATLSGNASSSTQTKVTEAGVAITKNYILMSATQPTSTATAHTLLSSQRMWINAADKGKFELVLGNATATTTAGGQYGQLAMYSESTAGTYLKSASGTAWKTATLPAATGMLAMIENSTAQGSDTKPVKVAATGLITECSTYAGGTAVTLNGTSAAASTASFYAPTSAGTAGQLIMSNGTGAPSWTSTLTYETSTSDAVKRSCLSMGACELLSLETSNGYAQLTLGNDIADGSAFAAYSSLKMYNKSSGYHYIEATDTNTGYFTHKLPSNSGILVTTDGTPSAAIGGTTTPVYVTADGVIASCTSATANTASSIVVRDSSGNFSAGTITAALTGTASNASKVTNGFVVKTFTSTSNITVNNGTYQNVSANQLNYAIPTGYYPIGVVTAELGGSSNHFVAIQKVDTLATNTGTIIQLHNWGTANRTVSVTLRVAFALSTCKGT